MKIQANLTAADDIKFEQIGGGASRQSKVVNADDAGLKLPDIVVCSQAKIVANPTNAAPCVSVDLGKIGAGAS